MNLFIIDNRGEKIMAKMNVNFISYTLKRAVDLTVVIPSVTIPECLDQTNLPTHKHDPFPVLYLLHGYGNNHATWTGYSNVELYAEERQIAVVMLSAENKFYCDHGGEDNYFTFVSKELPEFIQNTFPVSSRKEDTYICGLSMGGYGSLIHGLSHPENFGAIGSLSGAVSVGKEDEVEVYPLLKQEHLPPLYIACGKEDFLYEKNVELVNYLKEHHIEHTADFVEDYTHEWRFWDLEVEKFMDWLPRQDAYASKKRKV